MAIETDEQTLNKSSREGHGEENSINRPLPTECSQQEVQESQEQELPVEYPSPLRQVLITIGLLLGMFLVRRLQLSSDHPITDLFS